MMKTVVTILVAALVALGIGFIYFYQTSSSQLAESHQHLDAAKQQLSVVSNELTAVRTEIGDVKTQMQVKVDSLQQNLSTVTDEKTKTQEQLKDVTAKLEAAQGDLVSVRKELEQERGKTDTLQKQNDLLVVEMQRVTKNLADVGQKLTDLEKTHATTMGHLTALREEYAALTKEKAALETKMHDLVALKEQIHEVKVEIHEQKVAERERENRVAKAQGNGGFLMKVGKWIAPTPRPSGKYPLTEEIHRDQ